MDVSFDIINKHEELKKGFSWVLKNNTANNLPYHNLNHLLTVVKYVYGAVKYYDLSEVEEKELLLAALFHDVNHSGGKETDEVNVKLAKDTVSYFIKEFDINVNIDEVSKIIDATQYPYVIPETELSLKQQIIRDADLMQVLEYNWLQQNILGIAQELGLDFETMLKGQRKFLEAVKFNTTWGLFWQNQRWDKVLKNLTKLEELYYI